MKFYRLVDRAILPQKATPGSAGYDLFSMDRYMLYANGRVMIPTGIAVAINEGWYGRIAPRSGLAAKHGIDVLAGVVDSDYRGEVKVVLHNTGNYEVEIGKDMAIAQLVIERCWDGAVEFVTDKNTILQDDLEFATERGLKGFGSSDTLDPDHHTNDGTYQ